MASTEDLEAGSKYLSDEAFATYQQRRPLLRSERLPHSIEVHRTTDGISVTVQSRGMFALALDLKIQKSFVQ